MTDGRKHNTVA